ncbi:glycine/D-amino acid oxidase-like deaminating enzyme [Lewinella aquimaris]|uniref:Glycine/D-amino acid oxidase-like deaminating enzyme n=1 Tax=Neolewinella aquimaris TaxID=1835722 RepID=A0A840DX99_9BACT|nr:FAD-dependent oxidoreductase [Neolewinella aquimaris]MBB4077621.1 glycine/D-amino acid oxidase-like deaminating enzyme [Neolewinella aquimaris]
MGAGTDTVTSEKAPQRFPSPASNKVATCGIDYLIIGQGLAGTLIGYRLEAAGHRVHYLDAPEQTAASSVAAGIINPITGRRFVKSWRIDELLPEARRLYGELETLLGVKLWHDTPLVRTLFNRGDENDWLARSADAGYADYMEDHPALGRIPDVTVPAFAYACVRHSARVDVSLLVSAFRDRISEENRFIAGSVDYDRLPDGYDRIIFCEGWRSRFNPYFDFVPPGGNKGEVLFVTTAEAPLDRLFKHRVFLVPQSDQSYWIGATSENNFTDDLPTPAAREYLTDRLREVMTVPFTITDHRAAIRPTARDRRMVIGSHPERPRLYIFNGLGTKGASLAPLGSRWLLELLEHGQAPPHEVDVRRCLDLK